MNKNKFLEQVIINTHNKRPVYTLEQVKKEAEKEYNWIMSFYDEVLDPTCKYYNDFEKGISVAALNFSQLI